MNAHTLASPPGNATMRSQHETDMADAGTLLDDHRQTVRCYLPLTITYEILEGQGSRGPKSLHTVCKDFSEGGLSIPVGEYLKPGSRLRLTIELPDDRRPVIVSGEVLWCKERTSAIGRTGTYYEAGMRLNDITGESKERFTRFICEMLLSTFDPFLQEETS